MKRDFEEKVRDLLKLGNQLINKGNPLVATDITIKDVKSYNSLFHELIDVVNENPNLLSEKQKSKIINIEIIDAVDLFKKDLAQNSGFIERFYTAYFTGDLFLSEQTILKNYVIKINSEINSLFTWQ